MKEVGSWHCHSVVERMETRLGSINLHSQHLHEILAFKVRDAANFVSLRFTLFQYPMFTSIKRPTCVEIYLINVSGVISIQYILRDL